MDTKRTQLSFNINPDIKQAIKIAAAKRNISMNLWLMRAIYIALSKEEPKKNPDGKLSPPGPE
jgi:predicted HicB family RNase H-like nuclease